MDRSELLSIIEKAAHYGRMHSGWDWSDVKRDLSRFLPPIPAEQDSGERHIAFLRRFKQEFMGPHEQDALNAAIAALSQRPVVDESMAKDALRYRIVRASPSLFEGGHGYLTGIEADAKVDAYIEHTAATTLAPQHPEKGEG